MGALGLGALDFAELLLPFGLLPLGFALGLFVGGFLLPLVGVLFPLRFGRETVGGALVPLFEPFGRLGGLVQFLGDFLGFTGEFVGFFLRRLFGLLHFFEQVEKRLGIGGGLPRHVHENVEFGLCG